MSDDSSSGSGDDAMGDDVYQPTEEDQADVSYAGDMENALDEPTYDDTLDTGFSPPEKPLAVNAHGTTAREQREGRTLEERLREELPEVGPPAGDGIGDQPGEQGEPAADSLAGETRTGRLTAPGDENPRRRDDVTAEDVGIDAGAAGAEEAAMHTRQAEPEPGEPDT